MNEMIVKQQETMIEQQKEEIKKRILWIDIETTGVEHNIDRILQFAFIITDYKHNTLIEEDYVVKHDRNEVFEMCDKYVQNMHSKTGLWDRIETEGAELEEIDRQVSEIIKANMNTDWGLNIGGDSVHFDFYFIKKNMPLTAELLSHRLMDITSVLQWFRASENKVDVPKVETTHDALDDIRNSIRKSKCILEKVEEIRNTYKNMKQGE